MNKSYRSYLAELISKKINPDFPAAVASALQGMSAEELAGIFVDVAFLVSAIKFVGEEQWLQNKKSPKEAVFPKFIKKLLKTELSPVLFMHDFFESSSAEEVGAASENASIIEEAAMRIVKTRTPAEQRIFASAAVRKMSELFEFEHQLNLSKQEQGLDQGLSLYRTFDNLDAIFNIDYLADKGMVVDPENKERLYEGAGVGVQSSYATALIALRYLNPVKGSRFIDLGSGYGRVGLAVGLMRPDLNFIGYESVAHRVDIASAACSNLGLSEHVRFAAQDLASHEFQIPAADTYYIYDSFSESTYQHVLARLADVAATKKITIVTKGNARQWLEKSSAQSRWSLTQQIDGGNLCFFRSH